SSLAIFALGASAARRPVPPAFHVHLVRAKPAENDTLAAAPKAITLWFSEAPELALTSIKVTRADQKELALDALTKGEQAASNGGTALATVVAPVKGAVEAGTYTVAWKTAAKDGHPSRGTYSFVVAAQRR